MTPVVDGGGEANPWLSTRKVFQNLPHTYIKLAREVTNACKINSKMKKINFISGQNKCNFPSFEKR